MERRRSGLLALVLTVLGVSGLVTALLLVAGGSLRAVGDGPMLQGGAGSTRPPGSCTTSIQTLDNPDIAGGHADQPGMGSATDGPAGPGLPCVSGCTANGNCNKEEGR